MSTAPEQWIDTLLAQWPSPSDDATHDEARLDAILAKLDAVSPHPSPSPARIDPESKILLAPPLDQSHNTRASELLSDMSTQSRRAVKEEDRMAVSSERQRDRQSLQDLARMASAPDSFAGPPSARASAPSSRQGEDSGVIDLQSLSSLPDPSAEQLPAVEPSSAVVPVAVPSSAPAVEAAAPSSAAVSIPPAAPASVEAPVQAQPAAAPASPMSGPRVGVIAGGLVGVLALAAGTLFYLNGQKPAAPAPGEAAAAVAVPAPVVEPAITTPAAETAPAATVAAAEQAPAATEPGSLDPAALPTVDTSAPAANGARAAHTTGGSTAVANKAVASTDKPTAAEKAAADKAEKAAAKKGAVAAAAAPKVEEAPSGVPAGALGNAMRQASGEGIGVGSGTEKASAPQFAAGSVPQHPSQGALTSALGKVMGKARACMGEDDPVSRAMVTFSSAGTVQNVKISGHAAGKPAEACMKSALSTATVAPFAEQSYTTAVTLRP